MAAQTFGTVLLWLIIAAIAVVIAVYILRWLYRRSTKETAFVRTGFLGEKVVVNGGAFVIPVLHEITPVNMNVMRIEVRREDAMGADHQEPDARRPDRRILRAGRREPRIGGRRRADARPPHAAAGRHARTCSKASSPAPCARSPPQMTLEEMHEKRGDYAARVRELAAESLAVNGLELESVAIVDLDQTSLEFFDPSNAFDAEGLTQLTESIETRRKMRNEIEQRTLVDIRNQNLDTQRKVLEIDRETEYARLEQEREVEIRRASQRSELARRARGARPGRRSRRN